MDLDKAEDIAKESDYADLATNQDDNPINFADAAQFVLVGYKQALKEAAEIIHYPDYWDTARFPKLGDALKECYKAFNERG